MIRKNLCKTSIVSCFCIFMLSNISLASSFRTPKDTMETMLDAARKADAHLWNTCLSDIDKKIYAISVGKKKEQELLSEKSRAESKCGFTLGENAYEFAMFNPVYASTHERRKLVDAETNKLFDMAYIKQELIWDDKFAEVVLIIPIKGKGLWSPMTFYFVKENDQWKLFQDMTASLLLGWSAANMYDYNDLVTFKIVSHTDLGFDRRNCTSLKKRDFPITNAVSNAYKQEWNDPSAGYKDDLLALWLLTGDEQAEVAMKSEEAKKRLTKGPQHLPANYRLMLAAWGPCKSDNTTGFRPQKRLPFDTAEGWFMASNVDILAFQKLQKKFINDRVWCARAQFEMARRIAYMGNPELAIKEYERLIWQYPDQQKEVTEAKSELEKLMAEANKPTKPVR